MKKILTMIALFIASAFLTISSAQAATRITFNESSNGNVNTTLYFDSGFVGGIDLKLKINGNVDYKSFNLNSNITNKKYTTKVDYDDKNNTLNILIVTGGVGTSYNLLNNKKELALGTLVVSSNSKNDVSYTIECTGLTVLDNTWSSSTPSFEEVDNKLTYTASKEDEEHKEDESQNNPDNKPNDDNNNNDNDNQEANTDNNLSGGTTNNNTSSNGNNGTSSNDKDTAKDDKDDDEKDKDDKEDKEDITNKTEDNDKVITNEEENKPSEDKQISKLWFIIPIVAIVVAIAIVYVISKKRKKPNNEFDI